MGVRQPSLCKNEDLGHESIHFDGFVQVEDTSPSHLTLSINDLALMYSGKTLTMLIMIILFCHL